MNDGGSHHFSAARYIAHKLGTDVPLQGKLYMHRLCPANVEKLNEQYFIYAINGTNAAASNALNSALKMFHTTHYWHDMPHPLDDRYQAIFLPKNESRSERIAGILEEHNATNLGKYLQNLSTK